MDESLNRSGKRFQNNAVSVSRFTGFVLGGRKADSYKKKVGGLKSGSILVSGKLTTYPSPKSPSTLSSHLGQIVGLGKG